MCNIVTDFTSASPVNSAQFHLVNTTMTEREFSDISLSIGLTIGILYMLFIIYKLAEESKAGKYGLMVLMVVLGLGIFGFAVKYVIKSYLATQIT